MPHSPNVFLLETTEHLVAAHKSAKLYGDRTATALIEAAMFHVGRTLAAENRQAIEPAILVALGTGLGRPGEDC